jgi:hypothetical protein
MSDPPRARVRNLSIVLTITCLLVSAEPEPFQPLALAVKLKSAPRSRGFPARR